MKERAAAVTFQGNPLTLLGEEISTGAKAPDCCLVGPDLLDVKISDYAGKIVVVSVVPSLDTGVCATQTRTFNKKATELSDSVVILTVSRDLPFAQSRFCGAEGIDRVAVASDYKYREFGEAWGVLIKELELLTRAVFVVDKSGVVTYMQYVPEVTDEPDYDSALNAVENALG